MESIYEGKWNCKKCSGVNRGSHLECVSCGWTRDSTVEFYLGESAPVVIDSTLIKLAESGPDWTCPACSNSNQAIDEKCRSCSSPPSYIASEVDENDNDDSEDEDGDNKIVAPANAIRNNDSSLSYAGILLYVLAILSFLIPVFRVALKPHVSVVTVKSLSWRRTISTQVLTPVHESRWDSAPDGAYAVDHKSEIDHYDSIQVGTHQEYRSEKYVSGYMKVSASKRVKTGTKTVVTGKKNLGNGFFKDLTKEVDVYENKDFIIDEPIYSTRNVPYRVPTYESIPRYREKFYYSIDKWLPGRDIESSGNIGKSEWGVLNLAENERECGRSETYRVIFVDHDSNEYKFSPSSASSFVMFVHGSQWTIRWNNLGNVEVLGPFAVEIK